MKNEQHFVLQFIYSEKATKFCEILTLLLSYAQTVKSKVKISQNFVAFSVVYDQNLYFGFGPIPKPKSKLADTFGQYRNRYRNRYEKYILKG